MVVLLYHEIMMLRDLDHNNIVRYLGYGWDDTEGMINIFLKYVSVGSAVSRIALYGAFDEPLSQYFTRNLFESYLPSFKKYVTQSKAQKKDSFQ